MSASEAEVVCSVVRQALPTLMSGSLRIWGQFFGKPYDNFHRVVGCRSFEDGVRFDFNDGETLTVWQPSGWSFDDAHFTVNEAARVRWTWFYYGREKRPENLFFLDYVPAGDRVIVSTNDDFYPPPSVIERQGPAAELL